MEQNPYQPPAADLELDTDLALAEETRRNYLTHETSVRSVGLLYYLGAAGLLLSAIILLVQADHSEALSPLWLLFMAALGVLYLWVGRGLRTLQPKVRGIAAGLAALGLLSFPVGTLINGYILYLLLSAKGKMVFSSEYGEVIAATPHIKYRTSIIIWIFVALIVLGIAAAIIIPAIAPPPR